jgi:type IV pilus assembly protein PilA
VNSLPLRTGIAAALVLVAACSKKPTGAAPVTAGEPALVAKDERSRHFAPVSSHLELGGTLYGYADVDGDALALAASAQVLVHNIAASQPQLAPLERQDFKALFTELGLDDVKAVGFSSVQETSGNYRNRTFLYTPDGRHGLLAVLGGAPRRFTGAKLAPPDCDFYSESEFDVKALYDTLNSVVSKAAGPNAASSLEASLKSSGDRSGISWLDVIRGMRGRVTIIARLDPEATQQVTAGPKPLNIPAVSLMVKVDGVGGVLEAALEKSGALEPSKDGRLHVYTLRSHPPVTGIQPVLAVEGKTLFAASTLAFLDECLSRKEGLETNPEFATGLATLGPEGNGLTWMSQRFFSRLRSLGSLNPDASPEQKHVFDIFALNLPIINQPLFSVRTNLPDGILVRSNWNRSLKSDIAMFTVYNPVTLGLMAAMAIPAYQKVQQASREKEMMGNLHTLYDAAEQYYLINGASTVTYDQLVGPGKLVGGLYPVEGEAYSDIVFTKGVPLLLHLPGGGILKYPPGPLTPAQTSLAPANPGPKRPLDDRQKRYQQISVVNNLFTLDEAAKKYYIQNHVDTATYDDLVGPGKLVRAINVVAGEDYKSLVFARGQRLEVRLSDGRTVKYPLGSIPKASQPEPSGANPAQGDDSQMLAMEENLRRLYEAADKYYSEHESTSTTFEQLVGPTKYVPAITAVAGEDYRPLLFKKDRPLRLYLKDGRVIVYPPQQKGP